MKIEFDFKKNNFEFKKLQKSISLFLNKKIGKKTTKILSTILISFVVSMCVFVLLLLALWQNRDLFLDKIFPQEENIIEEVVKEEVIESLPDLSVEKEEIEEDKIKTVVEVVKEANPKVVSIQVNKEVPKVVRFLNIETGKFETKEEGVEDKKVGEGSGFLISKNGTIVTNRHVVEGEDLKYLVNTNDGVGRPATIVAIDPVYDVAIIKIEGSNYPYFELDDSDNLSVGESVIAIGNALGEFKNSVSVGVVSGLSRSVLASTKNGNQERLEQVIQIDAAINPGNSGGPLVNLYGKVVGINVAVAKSSENIGFALPINSVKDVILSVEKNGKIVRPYLGVRYVPVSKELQESKKLSVDYGALIVSGSESLPAVLPGSPAYRAGLKEGDIILSVDGRKIDKNSSFALLIRDKKVGDIIILSILSDEVTKKVHVLLDKALD